MASLVRQLFRGDDLATSRLRNKLRRADSREHKDGYWLNQVVALPPTGEDFSLGELAAVLREADPESQPAVRAPSSGMFYADRGSLRSGRGGGAGLRRHPLAISSIVRIAGLAT